MKKYLIIFFLLFANASYAQPPRIDSMLVDEMKSELHIFGDFGSPKGAVWVDSVEMVVKSWSDTLIVDSIPRFGKGSAGPVVVGARGYRGDKRYLSQWIYSVSENGFGYHIDGRETETVYSDVPLTIRCDVHSKILSHSNSVFPVREIRPCILHHTYNSTRVNPPSTYNFDGIDTLNYIAYVDLKNYSIGFGTSFNLFIRANFSGNPFSPHLDSSLHIVSGIATWNDGANIQSAYTQWSGNNNFLPPSNVTALAWAPILVSPKKDSSNLGTDNIQLLWDSLKFMNSYHIQINADSITGALFLDTISNFINIPITHLSKNIQYFWRVAGVNSEGESRWSDVWNFWTGLTSADVEEVLNNTLTLSSPQRN